MDLSDLLLQIQLSPAPLLDRVAGGTFFPWDVAAGLAGARAADAAAFSMRTTYLRSSLCLRLPDGSCVLPADTPH